MFLLTGLVLVLVGSQNVHGQDVQVTLDKDCYDKGTSMTLTATYAGSDTILAVIWFFSGRDSQDVIVDTGCTLFQTDTGYPLARMTYKCPPDTADSNTYQLILSNINETDFGSYEWGATFQVSTSNPDVVKIQPGLCQTTTTPDDCKWWNPKCWPWHKILIVILICVVLLEFLIGFILGCLLIMTTCCCVCFYEGESCEDCGYYKYCGCECCASTLRGACCNIGGLPPWYQRLWASIFGSPVALGIWVVWKCCGQANRPGGHDQPGNEEPLHERNNFN